LSIAISQSTANRFWETDLGTWFKEVLSFEYVFWCKFTKIFLGRDFAWEQRRSEACTRLHFAASGLTFRGWTGGGWTERWCVHALFDRVSGFVDEHKVYDSRDRECNEDLPW
jgi:hypothetical protein